MLFADTFYFLELEHNDGTWRWRQVATSFRTYAYCDLLRPVGLDRGYRDTSIAVTAEYRRNLRAISLPFSDSSAFSNCKKCAGSFTSGRTNRQKA